MDSHDREREIAESLTRNWQGPMSEEELAFLRDLRGFVDFAIRNGLSFPVAISALSHDLNEVRNHDFSIEQAISAGSQLKLPGFAEYTNELVGQTEDVD